MTKMIEVSEDRYDELLDAEQFLEALSDVGVDNWNGYYLALEILEEWNKESDNE